QELPGRVFSDGVFGQELQGHVSPQHFILRAIDDTHSPFADLRENAVVPEHLVDQVNHWRAPLCAEARPAVSATRRNRRVLMVFALTMSGSIIAGILW